MVASESFTSKLVRELVRSYFEVAADSNCWSVWNSDLRGFSSLTIDSRIARIIKGLNDGRSPSATDGDVVRHVECPALPRSRRSGTRDRVALQDQMNLHM